MVLVVRQGRQLWKMRRVVVTKNKSATGVLVLVDVHVALHNLTDIDILSQVQNGAVSEVQAPLQETDMSSPHVVGYGRSLDMGCRIDGGRYFTEVILDQLRRTPSRACF